MTWRQFAIYGLGVAVSPVVGMGLAAVAVRVFTGRW